MTNHNLNNIYRWISCGFVSILALMIVFPSTIISQAQPRPTYGAIFRLNNPYENDIRVAFAYPDDTWTIQKIPSVFDYSSTEYSINRPHWLSDGRLIGTGFSEEGIASIDFATPRSHLYIYDPLTDELKLIGDGALMIEDNEPVSWQLERLSPDEKYIVLKEPFLANGKSIIVDLETETIVAEFNEAQLRVLDIQGTQFLLANILMGEFWLVDVRNPATEVRVIPDINVSINYEGYILDDNKLLLEAMQSIQLLDSANDFASIWQIPEATHLKLNAAKNFVAAYVPTEQLFVYADISDEVNENSDSIQFVDWAHNGNNPELAFDFVSNQLVYWEAGILGSDDSCFILRYEWLSSYEIFISTPYFWDAEHDCTNFQFWVSHNFDALIEHIPETGSVIVHTPYQPAESSTDENVVDYIGEVYEASEPLWPSHEEYPDTYLSLANLYAAEPVPVWYMPTYTNDGNWLYLYEASDSPNYAFINIYTGTSYYLSIPYSEHYRYITSSPDEQWFLNKKRDPETGQLTYSVFNQTTHTSEVLLEVDYGIMARSISEIDLYYFVEWSPVWTE